MCRRLAQRQDDPFPCLLEALPGEFDFPFGGGDPLGG
jgi:hypothetical protein